MERIWFKDPARLFNNSNFGLVIPLAHMTFAEQLNSVLRLSIYYSGIVVLVKQQPVFLLVPIVTGLITFGLYKNAEHRSSRAREDAGCHAPTKDNPFMNVIHTESYDRPAACDPMDPKVARKVKEYFDDTLFRDVDDVWGQKTKTRQFVTNPVTTVPNDQKAFGEWLYGDMRRAGKKTRPPMNSA